MAKNPLPYFSIRETESRKLLAVIPAVDTTTAMCIGCGLFGPEIYVEKLASVKTLTVADKLINDLRIAADIERALEVQSN